MNKIIAIVAVAIIVAAVLLIATAAARATAPGVRIDCRAGVCTCWVILTGGYYGRQRAQVPCDWSPERRP